MSLYVMSRKVPTSILYTLPCDENTRYLPVDVWNQQFVIPSKHESLDNNLVDSFNNLSDKTCIVSITPISTIYSERISEYLSWTPRPQREDRGIRSEENAYSFRFGFLLFTGFMKFSSSGLSPDSSCSKQTPRLSLHTAILKP